jgi:hypothetical protein
MASLGNVGRGIDLKNIGGIGGIQSMPGLPRIRLGTELLTPYVSRDTTEGDPAVPSLRIIGPHRRSFYWPVEAGTRTISVKVKYSPDVSGARPKLIVKANSDIGISTDSEEEAATGTGWLTIGPISVTPSVDGVLECELRFDHIHEEGTQTCYWDTVTVT